MTRVKLFRTKLWLYFMLFAAIIFSILWILQTVFLQSFYNKMLIKDTRQAAEEILAVSQDPDAEQVIDRLACDHSLLVYVTEADGTIRYSSDSYKASYHQQSAVDTNNGNPYREDEQMNWQIGSYRNLPDGYDNFLLRLQESDSGQIEYQSENQFVWGAYMESEGGEKLVLYVSTVLGAVGAAAAIIRVQLLWVTILSLLIAFVLAYFIAKRFSAPVAQLSVMAKKLGDEDYSGSFQQGFCREIDELGNSLDQTAVKLSEARMYQKELLANVSHDLRTPLTMIKGYAEMVRDISWEDEAQRNSDIGIIIEETDRLAAMVNEILEYSKLQQNQSTPDFEAVNLSELTEKIVEQFQSLFHQEGGSIELKTEDGCSVWGNAAMLSRAIYNLIDNAIRHTGENKRILVTVFLFQEAKVRLEVHDYGEGIAEEEIPYIWEKYYTSRQRGYKGVSGLGLAIVKQIAVLHSAGYGVDSQKGSGSVFWIEIPKIQ
ncbi:MAG: ATP-binding protein [Coprococcus sp.]